MAGPAKGSVVGSSPGRALEKFPAPPRLVSLLRGRSGSKSRRASIARASPIFAFRRRITGGGSEQADVAGEPSSPKVTCIGQVRIRNKNKKKKKKKVKVGEKKVQQRQCSCRCSLSCSSCSFRALFCIPFKPAARWVWAVPCTCWRWWALPPLRFHNHRRYQHRRQSLKRDTATPLPTLPAVAAPRFSVYSENSVEYTGEDEEEEAEDEEEEEEGETKVFVSSATTTPPKNALLLMRCRSAPHNRSSSLATRFWVSPLAESPAATEKQTAAQTTQAEEEAAEKKDKEEEEEERLVGGRESFESTSLFVPGTSNGDDCESEEQRQVKGAIHPLVLVRSKSEPARKAVKFVVPESSYLNNPPTSGRRRLAKLAQEPRPPPLIPTTEPSS